MTLSHPLFGYPDPTPTIGDIVLRTSSRCPTDYVLCPSPAPAQIRCSAYARAFDVAKRWARRQHVDVWFTDNDKTFALVSRHRADGPLHGELRLRSGSAVTPFDDPPSAPTVAAHVPRPNTLVIGPRTAVATLIAAFLSDALEPVIDWDPAADDTLPAVGSGTLVIWNAPVLGADAQHRLFDFVGDRRGSVQVITVAENELFDYVERGVFMAALYYRLSVVRFHIAV